MIQKMVHNINRSTENNTKSINTRVRMGVVLDFRE